MTRVTTAVLLVLGSMVTGNVASADNNVVPSIAALTEVSSLILTGEVVASESEWNGGLIVTRSRVRVTECLLGDCPPTVTVDMLGGQIGDIVQAVDGGAQLPLGEEVILFLRSRDAEVSYSPVGLASGWFELRLAPAGFSLPELRLIIPEVESIRFTNSASESNR
jgi:hypothetical protein